MNCKNIIRTTLLLATVGSVTYSCRFEEKDIFDESAQLRLQHTNEEIKEILCSESEGGKNGWIIQYFVGGSGTKQYEGFNLYGKFYRNGKVTLSSDHRFLRNDRAGKYTEATSSYEMLQEDGPVLGFNTWNDVLTVFVDPVSADYAPDYISNDGTGLFGDQNLVMKSYSKDELIFRGERHSGIVRFIPNDRTGEQYAKDVAAFVENVAHEEIPTYHIVAGNDTSFVAPHNSDPVAAGFYSGAFVIAERISNPQEFKPYSIVFTPNGFRFEKELEFKGHKAQNFTITEDKNMFRSEDNAISIIPMWREYVRDNGAWLIDYTSLSAEQKSLFSQIDAEIKNFSQRYSLASVGLGYSDGKDKVQGVLLSFWKDENKVETITVGLGMEIGVQPGKFDIKAQDAAPLDYNMQRMCAKATGLEALTASLAKTLAGEYTATADNYFLPKSLVYTRTDGYSFSAKFKETDRTIIE